MYERKQFNLLRGWIMAGTSVPEVIFAHPDAPRPQTDYISLNLTRSTRIGYPMDIVYEVNPLYLGPVVAPFNPNEPEHPFLARTVQEIEFVWSLHAFSRDPINLVNRLQPWWWQQQGRELLEPLNIFRIADVQRIPEFINQNWNERAVTELFVRSYVCTGTTQYGTQQVLLGHVPTDTIEMVETSIVGV